MNVGIISLGCAKNRVDSETIAYLFQSNDVNIVQNFEDADILLVNTCGFIESSKQEAIDTIFEMVKFTNTNANADSTKAYIDALYAQLDKMAEICGLILEKKAEILDEEIEKLIQERQDARKAKNFARADEIRNQLLEQGIVLEDTREGVKWKRA